MYMKKAILCMLVCLLLGMLLFAVQAADTVNVDVIADYGAAGDGVTNDREAIQRAIDEVHAAGGGTVTLTAGKTFLSTNIILKSNVTLRFGDGAKLKQCTDINAYVKPTEDGYESYTPLYGRNFTDTSVKYNHTWYSNYPFIYAGEGTENVKITGAGIIEMTRGSLNNGNDTICVCPVGLYRVKGFEISDITIQNYCTYAIMPYTCNQGLIRNVTIQDAEFGSGDGISLMNSQDIRITGCNITTNDDAIYIFSSYDDPRAANWWSSADPQPSKNIEIDNNVATVTWTDTKAIGFILWGAGCPDQSLVEVSNVYIHDNQFNTMGIWNNHPYDTSTQTVPMKNIRFENNTIGTVQNNFYTIPMSDVYGYDCMTEMLNGDFESTGEAYWVCQGSAGAAKDSVGQAGSWYGYIDNLDKEDAKLYQGLKLESGKTFMFTANVQTSGAVCRMFVRDQQTQELIAYKEFSNTTWGKETLIFEVPETGNYQIGIERGNAVSGWARIDSAEVADYFLREQTIFTTQVPTDFDEINAEAGKAALYELGTRFSARKAGYITKVRIYTYAKESGVHTVRIWDYENQTVLAGPYQWNVTAGTQGWQEFELPEPLYIEADKDYVVAVSNEGNLQCYARGKTSANNFTTPILNGDLITYTTSGLYSTALGTMPNSVNKSVSYFRDVVFVPEQTIFTTEIPTDYDTELSNNYDLGTRFQSSMPGEIIKVRIYTHKNESATHTVRIWDYAAQKVIAGPYTWTVAAGTEGWQEFELPQALTIEAGKDYMVSVTNDKSYYARGKNSTNNFAAPICNGDLITYVGSGYYTTNVGSMPNKQNRNYNYFRDVVFVPNSLDKSALESAVADGMNIQRGDHTADSWQTFATALAAAQNVLAETNATQSQVDTAAANLTAAINGLTVCKVVTDPYIELSQTEYIYDASAKNPTVIVKDGSTVIPESEYSLQITNNVNAGTATVTIIDNANGSYEVSGSATFTIRAAAVTITADDQTAVVGSAMPQLTYQVTGLVSGESLTIAPSVTCQADMATVGDYEILIYGADAGDNYTISYVGGTLAVVEADKLALRELVDAQAQVSKGDYTDASWDVFQAALTAAREVLQNKQATTEQVNAAVDALDAAAKGLTKYKDVTAPVIVLEADVLTYDGTEKKPAVIVKDADQVIPAEEYEVSYADNIHAGTATVTITNKAGGEYRVNGSASFTIKPAVIVITAENKTAGTNTAEPGYTYTVNGLLGDDKLLTAPTLSCKADMSKAGVYEIVPSGADAGSDYTVTYVSGTLTVVQVTTPVTGDAMPLVLCVTVMAAATAGIVMLLCKRKQLCK